MRLIQIIMLAMLVLVVGCGGGSPVDSLNPPSPKVKVLTERPLDVVARSEPPSPPGTPTGKSIHMTITISTSRAFDLYCWNDALEEYTFFWQHDSGTESVDGLFTPDFEYEVFIEHGNQYRLIDLTDGNYVINFDPFGGA